MRIYNEYDIVFSGFVTFDEMLLSCHQKYTLESNSTGLSLEILPAKPILIDKTLDTLFFFLLDSNDFYKFEVFIVQNVRGIEITCDINNQMQGDLIMAFSTLDFYANHTLISRSQCNYGDLLKGANAFFYLFRSAVFTKVKYPAFLCPNVFNGSLLLHVVFNGVTNSFLNKNVLRVISLEHVAKLDNMNFIRSMSVELVYHELGESILNEQMFKNVKIVAISGVLNRIEPPTLLANFKLNVLQLNIENLGDFLHRGTAWIRFLNERGVHTPEKVA